MMLRALLIALPFADAATLTSDEHMNPVHKVVTLNQDKKTQALLKTSGSLSKAVAKSGINPPVENVASDKKFFGPPFPADYPDDIKPPANKKLFGKGAMYPKVQEEGFFDKDYVKDENGDGGKWQAQMDYDTARTRIAREKRQAENAAKRAENEKREFDDAAKRLAEKKRKEEEAAAAAKAAEEAARKAKEEAARRAARKAEEKRAEAEAAEEAAEAEEAKKAEEQRKVLEKEVKDAEDALAKQKTQYKDCLEELRDAKAKVNDLEEQQAQLEQRGTNTTKLVVRESGELKAEKQALQEAKARRAAAEAKHKAAVAKLEEANKATAEAKRKLDQEKAESNKVRAQISKKEAEVKEAERDLEASKKKLRKIRGMDETPEEVAPRSGSTRASVLTIFALFAAYLSALP